MPSISEEIKQKKFKSEQQKAMLNILLTANTIYACNSRFFKNYGLSPEQYNVLRILRGNHPETCTVIYIQERMLDKMSNASRLIDKLEAKNLVDRTQSDTDRRQVKIRITDEGIELLKTIDVPFSKMESQIKCIPEDELVHFNEILDALRNGYCDTCDMD